MEIILEDNPDDSYYNKVLQKLDIHIFIVFVLEIVLLCFIDKNQFFFTKNNFSFHDLHCLFNEHFVF